MASGEKLVYDDDKQKDYDTMHFEFRPELQKYAATASWCWAQNLQDSVHNLLESIQ